MALLNPRTICPPNPNFEKNKPLKFSRIRRFRRQCRNAICNFISLFGNAKFSNANFSDVLCNFQIECKWVGVIKLKMVFRLCKGFRRSHCIFNLTHLLMSFFDNRSHLISFLLTAIVFARTHSNYSNYYCQGWFLPEFSSLGLLLPSRANFG